MLKQASKTKLVVFCLLLGIASQLLFSFMVRLIDEKHYANQRMDVASQLGDLRLRLEQQLNSTFYVTRGLAVLIGSDPVSSESQLEKYRDKIELWAGETSVSLPYLRNIGLSEGYVLRYVYPLEGNEKVIGLDYRNLPGQWEAVERAIATRQPVVAGPLELIQGGAGIIFRIPLYVNVNKDSGGRFVGIVSMVLDYQALLQSAGLTDAENFLAISIRGKDGLGKEGELFHGSQSVFDQDGVTLSIQFLGGEWQIGAKPSLGWAYESPYSGILKWLGYALSLLVSVLAYYSLAGLQQARLFADELEQRVQERTQQLLQAKDDAEQANRSKSAFLAVVTHELRTPLNSIIGLTQLVTSMKLEPLQRQYLEKVSTSATLLLGLINNVLTHSKNKSGKEQLKEKAFALQDTCKTLNDVFEVSASEKNISFVIATASNIPKYVEADEEKILQILTNLCGNAIKFTAEGEVKVCIERGSEKPTLVEGKSAFLRFTISDTGIGIDQTEQDRLFEPFSQVDTDKTREHEGTGLGLSISKYFVDLMGGKIGMESVLGQGSQFWFEIPIHEVDRLPEPVTSLSFNEIVSTAKTQLSGMKVILAEDNPFNQTLAIALLKKVGIEVMLAENGLEVLTLLEQNQVHAVLMDIQMPELDGIATTIKIRQDAKYRAQYNGLPIIAMTANTLDDDRQQARAAGMDHFVAKPIDLTHLYQVLIECLEYDKIYPQSNEVAPH